MTKKNMQRVKWAKGSHIYIRWANRFIFKNNGVVCKIQYWLLDTDSANALCIFIGFQKHVVAKTQHWFTNAFFFFHWIPPFQRKGKRCHGCKKMNSTSIHRFPINNIDNCYSMEELATGYSKSRMRLIFTESGISLLVPNFGFRFQNKSFWLVICFRSHLGLPCFRFK